jgi:hypothetical protein
MKFFREKKAETVSVDEDGRCGWEWHGYCYHIRKVRTTEEVMNQVPHLLPLTSKNNSVTSKMMRSTTRMAVHINRDH